MDMGPDCIPECVRKRDAAEPSAAARLPVPGDSQGAAADAAPLRVRAPALGWLTEKALGDGGERWAIRGKALHTLMAGRDSLLLAGPRDYFIMTGRPAVSDPSRFLPWHRRLSATFP